MDPPTDYLSGARRTLLRASAPVYRPTTDSTLPRLLEKIYGAAAMDRLGSEVAGGQIGGNDTIGDLLAVAPGATGAAVRSGIAYVRLGR